MLHDVDELAVESFGPEAVENTVPDGAAAADGVVLGRACGARRQERRFSLELRFSENFPGQLRYKMLRDEALRVTNGRATGAKRVARGQNQRWTIEVKPGVVRGRRR